jgi:methionyl-tRNA formyltransferase
MLDVVAVIAPGYHAPAPVNAAIPLRQPDHQSRIGFHSLTDELVHYAPDRPELAIQRLTTLQPDFLVVSCFPYLIKPSLRRTAVKGCINLHPSLLPSYRGPRPINAQIRDRQSFMGVTAHLLDDSFDTGDILMQIGCPMRWDTSEAQAESLLGSLAANLLIDTLHDWEHLTPIKQNSLR